MLDNFPHFIETENVDSRVVFIPRPCLMAMQDDVVSFCDHALELDPLAGVLTSHAVEVFDKGGFAIGASDPASTRIDSERRRLPTLLRIAPHYYNTETEIERAVARLASLV